MTGKADLTPEEWQLVAEAPPAAGLAVATAQRGGTFRESFALAKAYSEARGEHGQSTLLDDLLAERPKVKREQAHSPGELKDHALGLLQQAVAIIRAKGTAEELEAYRGFVMSIAERVANAHKEDGAAVGPGEQAVIEEISASLT
jgi:hypothetical protein